MIYDRNNYIVLECLLLCVTLLMSRCVDSAINGTAAHVPLRKINKTCTELLESDP